MAKATEGARYRKVYTQFWRDRHVLKLTESERLIALYCMTGPQSNRIGLFSFSIALAAEDFGNVPRTFAERLANVCRTLNWHYDEHARVLYIPSWWRWNPPQNVNVMEGNLKDLADLPQTVLLQKFIDNTANLPRTYAERLANVCETFAERSPIQEQEQEQYQEQEKEQEQKQEQEPPCRAALDRAEVIAAVEKVLSHYATYHPRAKAGDKERKLIRDRLANGFSADDLCDAIDGNHLSPHHCGVNDRQIKYHGLELIVRDATHVSEFIAEKDKPREPVLSIKSQMTAAAAESYLEKRKAIDGIF